MPSTIQFISGAAKVAQVQTITITPTGAYDATTNYKATIGNVTYSVINAGSTNATATALAAALTASNHPYFSYLTFTSLAGVITVTTKSDYHGAPFTLTVSVVTGGGTIATAVTVAATGPNHFDNTANWSGGVVPVTGDKVILADTSQPILWNIDQNAITLAEFHIYQTYTGKIGLNRGAITQSSNGGFASSDAPEYRTDIYMKISSTKTFLGENYSPTKANGSGRILIDFGSVTTQSIEVFNTAAQASETGKPAFRFKVNNSNAVLIVRSSPGGVGIAMDLAGETSSIGTISMLDDSNASKMYVGLGTTIGTSFTQYGGNNIVQAAATIPLINMYGGILETDGDFTITACNVTGGTFNCNNFKTGGNFITTLNVFGGTTDFSGTSRARTCAAANLYKNATLKYDPNFTTITALNYTSTQGPLQISVK